MTDPIIKTVTVPLSPDRAFRLFTEEIADWWPLDSHSISAVEGETAVSVEIPPKVGEQIIETRQDGSKVPWGRVTEWTQGKSLQMRWRVGRPESEGTLICVAFQAIDSGTQVTLTHENWQALGPRAAEIRARYNTGWDTVLGVCYLKACTKIVVRA